MSIVGNSASTGNSQSGQAHPEAAWSQRAPQLAGWVNRNLVNRRDCFGHYISVESRTDPDLTAFTDKSGLTTSVIVGHFRARQAGDLIGLHSTVRDETAACWSKWLAVDIDRHGNEGDPAVNFAAAETWYARASALGFVPLLLDSNGQGGYHLICLFDRPAPTEKVYAFGRWLTRDWKALGLTEAPELFPKQPAIPAGGFGNWLRVFGRHHTRPHFTRVWDGSKWLDGLAAVTAILATRGTKPEAIPDDALAAPATTPPKVTARLAPGGTGNDVDLARDALGYLTDRADPYPDWIKYGMCLTPLGDDGLALWEWWSAHSPKFSEGDCERKWRSFHRGEAQGDLKLGTIFHDAKERGWRPPSGFKTNGAIAIVWPGVDDAGPAPANGEPQSPGDDAETSKPPSGYADLADADLGIVPLASVQCRPTSWLWKYRFARGELAITAGDGGIGKSMTLLWMAAAVSRGLDLPDGSGAAPVGNTVIVSAEDAPEDTIKPRLIAMGADMGRITIVKAAIVLRKPGKPPEVHPQSFQDRPYWIEVFRRLNPALFIVDPIPSYLGRGVNDSKNIEIRQVLEPFLDMVIRPTGVSMVGNTHLNKAVDAKTPLHRIMGSMAYGNLPRNVHFVIRDPDDPTRRFFKQAKCNNAPDDLAALAFRVERRDVEGDGGELVETAIPVFEHATVAVNLGDAMSGGKGDGSRGPAPKRTMAVAEWLHDHLAGAVGGIALGAIFDAAGEAGLVGRRRTDGKWSSGSLLYQAKDRIPTLPEPRHGKRVDDLKFPIRPDGRPVMHWRLVDSDAAY